MTTIPQENIEELFYYYYADLCLLHFYEYDEEKEKYINKDKNKDRYEYNYKEIIKILFDKIKNKKNIKELIDIDLNNLSSLINDSQ